MLTFESQCLTITGGSVLVSRIQPNRLNKVQEVTPSQTIRTKLGVRNSNMYCYYLQNSMRKSAKNLCYKKYILKIYVTAYLLLFIQNLLLTRAKYSAKNRILYSHVRCRNLIYICQFCSLMNKFSTVPLPGPVLKQVLLSLLMR